LRGILTWRLERVGAFCRKKGALSRESGEWEFCLSSMARRRCRPYAWVRAGAGVGRDVGLRRDFNGLSRVALRSRDAGERGVWSWVEVECSTWNRERGVDFGRR